MLDNYEYIIYDQRVISNKQLPLKKIQASTKNISSFIKINFIMDVFSNFPSNFRKVALISKKHGYLRSFCCDDYIVYRCQDIFSLYISSDGQRIDVYYTSGHLERAISYTLGPGIVISLIKKKYIPLHCAAVNIDGQNIMLLADSGTGKSTLTMNFLINRAELITDDVLPIKPENLDYAVPSRSVYPKLWQDSIDFLKLNKYIYSSVVPGIDKYYVDINKRIYGDTIIDKIIVLSSSNKNKNNNIVVEKLSGDNIPTILFSNIHSIWTVNKEDRVELLKLIIEWLNKIESNIYHVNYPKNFTLLDKVMETIVEL